jgi:RNA polymerase sigma-70 factor, ECF subfamily
MRVDFHRSRDSLQTPRTSCQLPGGDQLWKLLLVVAIYQIRQNSPGHDLADDALQRAIGKLQAQDCSDSNESFREVTSTYLGLVLDSILERLPHHHRMIVTLRLDGCELADLARLTGRSMRSVERILHESCHMLASLIDERGMACT